MVVVEDLCKKYRGTPVLDHVSITCEAGKVTGLVGPNGSGKTMLMRAIAGLIKPTSGRVLIDGQQIGKDIFFPKSCGLLLEGPAFLERKTAYMNLKLLSMIKRKATSEQIRQWIRTVGLDPESKIPYRKFSLGMKQRLGIAGAMFEEPDLLLLDEPTNALDTSGVRMLIELVQEAANRGATVLLASHDNNVMHSLAHKIWHMAEGHVDYCEEIEPASKTTLEDGGAQ
ncbi:MAG: ABC transporter ATP-binding protein [Coriobacteriales bacterium]|nr:ABC transporter ATP-binding protein [Coriobacteriales bacterium]